MCLILSIWYVFDSLLWQVMWYGWCLLKQMIVWKRVLNIVYVGCGLWFFACLVECLDLVLCLCGWLPCLAGFWDLLICFDFWLLESNMFLKVCGVNYLTQIVLENRLLHSRVNRTYVLFHWLRQSPLIVFFWFSQSVFCRGCV